MTALRAGRKSSRSPLERTGAGDAAGAFGISTILIALAFLQGMSSEMHTFWVSGVMPTDADGRETLKRDLAAIQWLNEANRAKQRGFYVDFDGTGWLQPKDVRPEDLNDALSVAKPFIEETRRQQGMAKSL